MVHALKRWWDGLATHPRGRWLRLGFETLWLVGGVLLVWRFWDAPRWAFPYLAL